MIAFGPRVNLLPAARTGLLVWIELFLIFFFQLGAVASGEPADSKATVNTVKVLSYLKQLHLSPNHRIVSGQYVGSPGCCSPIENPEFGVSELVDGLRHSTGKIIGMIGVDYNDFNNAFGNKHDPFYGRPINYTAINAILKKFSRDGSLITIGWHARNPWTGKAWNDLSHFGHFGDLIDRNKAVSAAWTKELDAVAEGLEDLQSAGVVVLWRPFLEMNGRWFWWGATQPSQGEFRAVWRHLFQYFTQTKGLHNLLWVYSPNNSFPSNADQKPPSFYYPGGDTVDIVAVDDYRDSTIISQYDELSKLGKPLALGEKGPAKRTAGENSTAYVTLIPTLESKFPLVSYFQAWDGPYGIVKNPGASQLMNDPMTANQSDVRQALQLR